MNDLKMMFDAAARGMQIPINVYGFSFSLWDVFIWSIIAALVAYIVGRFLNG